MRSGPEKTSEILREVMDYHRPVKPERKKKNNPDSLDDEKTAVREPYNHRKIRKE